MTGLTQPFLLALAKGIEHSPALLIESHHSIHYANSLATTLLGSALTEYPSGLLAELVDFFSTNVAAQSTATINLKESLYTVSHYQSCMSAGSHIIVLVWNKLSYAPEVHPANNLFRDIINNIPQYIFLKDRHSRFITCNNQFAKLVGLSSPHEIHGKSDYDLPWSYEQAKTYREDDLTIMQNGEARLYYEEKQRDPYGKERTVLISKIPLFDTSSSNAVTGLAGIYHDITEVKELEQELISSKLHAEAANIAKSEFIANISHDIRTPITGMLGLAHHLKENTDSAECYHYADTLIASTQELLTLLNEVIDIIELEPSEPGKHTELFSPRSVAQHNMTLLSPAACHKGLQFTHRITPNVPLRLYGHRTYLDRILLNILSNAVKFTSRGRVELIIDARPLTPEQLELEITVTDTGIGIPSNRLEHIFDQYVRRAPTYQHIFKGSGLGLYVVKRHLDSIGGTIRVDSKVGHGSCFTVRLPLAINAPHEPNVSPKRAYVIEDSPIAGFMTQQLLQSLGFHTTLINSPDELPTPPPPNSLWIVSCKHTDLVATLDKDPMSSNQHTLIITSQHPFSAQQQRQYQALGVSATLLKPLKLESLREVIV